MTEQPRKSSGLEVTGTVEIRADAAYIERLRALSRVRGEIVGGPLDGLEVEYREPTDEESA